MSDGIAGPRRVWLKAFWGFDPGEDGYLGFTRPGDRRRLIEQWQPGDLVLIYGAGTRETEKENRRQALGFLEIDPNETTDIERMSPLGRQRKIDMNCADRWTYAVPVRRAWRVTRRIEVKHIAPLTYTHNMARVIASQGILLQPEEAATALELPVTPVNVFGEPPVKTSIPEQKMQSMFSPSRGLTPSFGTRESQYEDGLTYLYMHRFVGDVAVLLGRDRYALHGRALVKVGYSNNPKRRCEELNAGFPPAAENKWEPFRSSRPFPSAEQAKTAEDTLKSELGRRSESLGGEFFLGEEERLLSAFSDAASAAAFRISAPSKPRAPRPSGT